MRCGKLNQSTCTSIWLDRMIRDVGETCLYTYMYKCALWGMEVTLIPLCEFRLLSYHIVVNCCVCALIPLIYTDAGIQCNLSNLEANLGQKKSSSLVRCPDFRGLECTPTECLGQRKGRSHLHKRLPRIHMWSNKLTLQ